MDLFGVILSLLLDVIRKASQGTKVLSLNKSQRTALATKITYARLNDNYNRKFVTFCRGNNKHGSRHASRITDFAIGFGREIFMRCKRAEAPTITSNENVT